jgi:hypothetical protein
MQKERFIYLRNLLTVFDEINQRRKPLITVIKPSSEKALINLLLKSSLVS